MGDLSKKAVSTATTVFLGLIGGFIAIFLYFHVFTSPVPVPVNPVSSTSIPRTEEVYVKTVYDGDSIVLGDGRIVRLIGFDSPEKGKPYSEKARQHLKRLVEGRKAFLEVGDEKYDRGGRTLAYLYDGTTKKMVNLEMVREGLGYIYFFKGNMRYGEEFQEAQRAARAGRKKLWRQPVRREEYYVVSAGRTHRPGCGRMKRSKKKKVRFQMRTKAFDTGAPPCRKCEP